MNMHARKPGCDLLKRGGFLRVVEEFAVARAPAKESEQVPADGPRVCAPALEQLPPALNPRRIATIALREGVFGHRHLVMRATLLGMH